MISAKFEDEIWIYFQTNLRARTRKEYWNVISSFDKLTGHDPLKLTRKDAMNYYNNLIEKVNSGRLSYNTAVMRLSVMKSVCTFIETYTINHGKRYVNYFESMSLPEQDKILPKDAIPDTKEIDNLLSAALDANDNKAFLIFSLVIKMGLLWVWTTGGKILFPHHSCGLSRHRTNLGNPPRSCNGSVRHVPCVVARKWCVAVFLPLAFEMNVLICSCLHYFVPYLYRFKNSSAKIGGYYYT